MAARRSGREQIWAVAWFVFLAITLTFAAHAADRHAQQVVECPFACDPFGYLQMARRIREAHEPFCTDYHFEYPQTRQLIDALNASDIPRSRWEEVVAPHAHHYFPAADAVGPQYPPGTALMLAAFPEGVAVRRLNTLNIGALLGIGLGLIALAIWNGRRLGAVFVAVAAVCGLHVVAGIGIASFSINAMIVPLLLAVICSSVASWSGNSWTRLALGVASGACIGAAVFIRLPIVLIAPGLFILLLPASSHDLRLRRVVREPSLWFLLAVIVCGVLPVLLHQQSVTGDWYQFTYGTNDSALPSVEHVPANVRFYLRQPGLAGLAPWQVLAFALGWLLAVRAFQLRVKRRFVLAVLTTWAVPVGYFLMHGVTTDYYAIPSMFATVWLLALDFLRIEASAGPMSNESASLPRSVLAFVAATILIGQTVGLWRTAPNMSQPAASAPSMPAEFQESKPWIWADLTSGTIVYFADVPTFKITFTDPETRLRVFAIAAATGERQYLVVDCPAMEKVAAEIERVGGSLELRGEAAGWPYYLIHWPPAGPTAGPVPGCRPRAGT